MILLFSLLACGWGEGSPLKNPSRTDNITPETCTKVFTADDANRFFLFAGSLADVGECKFEDIHARHSTMELAFETQGKDKKKAKITITPTECVKKSGGLVAGAYTIAGVDEAKLICPEGIDALIEAFKTGKAPGASAPQ